MSLDQEFMLCNIKTCRSKISGFAWVTSCSHIFCDEDGAKEFNKSLTCPACNTDVSGKYDIVRHEVDPPEEYKSMVLSGLRPDIILEICSRAMSFWTSQVHQELLFQEHVNSKAKTRMSQVLKHYKQQIQDMTMEISNLIQAISIVKKKQKTYKAHYIEASEMLLKKNKQHQKLHYMCEQQRRHIWTLANKQKIARQHSEEKTSIPPVGRGDATNLKHCCSHNAIC
ncbi:E3 ubiquitin-protein ligase CCNB1IP1 isoform X1 [Lethenteron reissneri]|uniref:E3 ubiquitin-protein ligase CCNB1IP1 isoform X1 n=1 Tax=Lethenteron reissneri TaxID=7753 RepID=UPI002AB67BF3|nr:E3 ubiquitin-protein ligase CCNB1IP1 isoform X1 [Lethenteron reissneri]XP_061433329.1 E3 ubiquitin-protein ligase CCNB1IP1 isoform X1 [Lethenteron reissneri]